MELRDPGHWQNLIRTSADSEKPRIFEQALQIWPNSTELWLGYVQTGDSVEAKGKLLAKALPLSVDPRLYEDYIAHIRSSSPDTLSSAFEYALSIVSFDPHSGQLWKMYIDFLASETVSNEWEEQFRRDRVRKAYKRAITLPLVNIEALWRSYSTFENRISRVSARKFIDERSGAYMKARSALKTWQTLTQGLTFGTMPSVQDSEKSSGIWRKLIDWERGNALELGSEELKQRVHWVCQRATHCARWSAVVWFDAGLYDNAEMWEKGAEAMPESMLLSFKSAENYELMGQAPNVRRVLLRLAESLNATGEDPTPALAELVRSTHRLEGLEAARKCVVECLKSTQDPGPALYIAAANLEKDTPAKERSVWSLAYRKFGRKSSDFVVLYLDYLFAHDDIVNARAGFEQVADLKIRKVWDAMLTFESKYVQSASTSVKALKTLEQRYIAEFKDIDEVELFIQRYGRFSSILPRQGDTGVHEDDALSVPPGAVTQLLSMLPPANVYDGPSINNDLLIQLIVKAI